MDERLISEKRIERTADGSATIYLPLLDEHYHSIKGAYTESAHIFVDCALRHCPKQEVRVLEIGFGTGLNATLTASCRCGKKVDYHTVERYPLSPDIMERTGYYGQLDATAADLLRKMHAAPWDAPVEITPEFTLHKIGGDLTSADCPLPQGADVVYFDAFAPEKQPEMWDEGIFRRIYSLMTDGGILTTYCAKGEVRRRLQSVGFIVERLPGPPGGKREILRATKY